MENNDFDPQTELEEATAELHTKDSAFKNKKTKNPFKSFFSKKKKTAVIDYELDDLESDVDLDASDNFSFDPNNSEFDQNQGQLELNRSHLDPNSGHNLAGQSNFEDDSFESDHQTEMSFASDDINSPRKSKSAPAGITTKLLKIVAVSLVVAIICLLGYFFLQSSDTPEIAPIAEQEKVAEPTPAIDENSKDETEQESDIVNTDAVSNKVAVTETAAEASKENKGVDTASPADLASPNTVDSKATDVKIAEDKTAESSQTIDTDKILNAKIPTNVSLVKEEIDKLSDKDTRLQKQEELLVQRVDMMDELTDKKEDQIALLEKQIALLEAQSAGE